MCLPSIVEEFARLCARYELVYCYSILERNKKEQRLCLAAGKEAHLDAFFPFDPYRLKKSSRFFPSDFYLEWDLAEEDDEEDEDVGQGYREHSSQEESSSGGGISSDSSTNSEDDGDDAMAGTDDDDIMAETLLQFHAFQDASMKTDGYDDDEEEDDDED